MEYIDFLPYIPYAASIITLLGLFLLVMSRHEFFETLNPAFKKLPRKVTKRLSTIAESQVDSNPLLATDKKRLPKELIASGIRLKGEILTIYQLLILSIIFSIIGFLLAWMLTTKISYDYGQLSEPWIMTQTAQPHQEIKKTNYNIPALVITTIMGFILPRWYIFFRSLRARFMYRVEAPQALFKLAASLRLHPNVERAVIEVTPRLPEYTRILFETAINDWRSRKYNTFSDALLWVAYETDHISWKEFTETVLTSTTSGVKDILGKMAILTQRAERLLEAQKEERMGIKFTMFLVIAAFSVLLFQTWYMTFKNPSTGIYLYTTPIGKVLISLIFITAFFEVVIFSWLYYRV